MAGGGCTQCLFALQQRVEEVRRGTALAERGRQLGEEMLDLVHELQAQQAELERENAQLQQARRELEEASARKNDFLAMLAHELRNPLVPLFSAAQLLDRAADDPSLIARARALVQKQSMHMARLVDDLLDVCCITQGKTSLHLELVELAALVDTVIDAQRPVFERARQHLMLARPANPLFLSADPTRIAQILSNLLDNATKYSGPGAQIWLTLQSEGNEAVVRVRDTGIGVPSKMLGQIFELFFQATRDKSSVRRGLGLGLPLAKRLAELHGGSLSATSPGEGQGSEFEVRLPLYSPAEEELSQRRVCAQSGAVSWAPFAGLRVLVVDDSEDAAESLGLVLGLMGAEVRTAHDGAAALEAARVQQPQVVLLDIGMPGMDGYEVARRLRHELGLHEALLVALTGWGQAEDRLQAFDAGFDQYLMKPAHPEELQRLLSRVGGSQSRS